jgi:hypothetical protein
MKLLKFGIRTWITIASALSFLGGWAMLVHAPKPAQLSTFNTANVLPTLEPLQPLGIDTNSFQNQPLFTVRPRARSIFRTGAS